MKNLDLHSLVEHYRDTTRRRRLIRAYCAGFPHRNKEPFIALCNQYPTPSLDLFVNGYCLYEKTLGTMIQARIDRIKEDGSR